MQCVAHADKVASSVVGGIVKRSENEVDGVEATIEVSEFVGGGATSRTTSDVGEKRLENVVASFGVDEERSTPLVRVLKTKPSIEPSIQGENLLSDRVRSRPKDHAKSRAYSEPLTAWYNGKTDEAESAKAEQEARAVQSGAKRSGETAAPPEVVNFRKVQKAP